MVVSEYHEIAKKLFEMALEGFEKLLLEKSESQEKYDEDDDFVPPTNQILRIYEFRTKN